MKRLCLLASLVLVNACSSGDEYGLSARLVNGTHFSQKVVMDGAIQRKGATTEFEHTLRFNQTITAPALGAQRVSVLDPIDEEDFLIIYPGDCLLLTVLTPDEQKVATWEGLVPGHDVECRIAREGSTPDGSEGSLECNTQPPPDDQSDRAGTTGACDLERAQP
jgi:hypothetical protein